MPSRKKDPKILCNLVIVDEEGKRDGHPIGAVELSSGTTLDKARHEIAEARINGIPRDYKFILSDNTVAIERKCKVEASLVDGGALHLRPYEKEVEYSVYNGDVNVVVLKLSHTHTLSRVREILSNIRSMQAGIPRHYQFVLGGDVLVSTTDEMNHVVSSLGISNNRIRLKAVEEKKKYRVFLDGTTTELGTLLLSENETLSAVRNQLCNSGFPNLPPGFQFVLLENTPVSLCQEATFTVQRSADDNKIMIRTVDANTEFCINEEEEEQKIKDEFFDLIANHKTKPVVEDKEGVLFKADNITFALELTEEAAGFAVQVVKIVGGGAASAFPYLSIVSRAAGDLEEFCNAFQSNQDAATNYPKELEKCGRIVAVDMAEKVTPQDTESFRAVAKDFMVHLINVWKICDKWRGKVWWKKLRYAKRYAGKFDGTKKKIDSLILQIIAAFGALSEGHAEERHKEVCRKLSEMSSMEEDVAALFDSLSDLFPMLESLIATIEANHSEEQETLDRILEKDVGARKELDQLVSVISIKCETLISRMEAIHAEDQRKLDQILGLLHELIEQHRLSLISDQAQSITVQRNEDTDNLDDILQMLRRLTIQSLGTTTNALPSPMLPDRPELFGRKKELQELANSLDKMAALVGAAGTGKSHCAKYFVWQWVEEAGNNRTGFWLSADTEYNIRFDYQEMRDLLGIKSEKPVGELSTSDLARDIWKILKRAKYEWMLVFDNVPEDGPSTFSPWFFPKEELRHWGKGRVLFTTRSDAYSGTTCLGTISPIKVDALDKKPAMDMLLKYVIKNDSDPWVAQSKAAAEELVGKHFFDGLPLAIATASAEIIDRSITVQEYLEDIKAGLTEGIADAVAAAIEISLTHARQIGSGDVLDIAAFVNPDRIPLQLLGNDEVAVNRLLKLNVLRRIGIKVYSIHRLHQEAARKDRSPVAAIMAVKNGFAAFEAGDPLTWYLGLGMLSQAEALSSYLEKLGGYLHLEQDDHRLAYAAIIYMSGLVLRTCFMFNFEEALVKFEELLEIQQHVYGTNAKNADLAFTLHNLGNLYSSLGKYEEAHTKYEESLEMKRHVYGTNAKNKDLALTLHSLGDLYGDLGKYEEARAKYEESLEMKRHVYGANAKNKDLALALESLGNSYGDLGKHEEARAKYEESLKMKQHVTKTRVPGFYLNEEEILKIE